MPVRCVLARLRLSRGLLVDASGVPRAPPTAHRPCNPYVACVHPHSAAVTEYMGHRAESIVGSRICPTAKGARHAGRHQRAAHPGASSSSPTAITLTVTFLARSNAAGSFVSQPAIHGKSSSRCTWPPGRPGRMHMTSPKHPPGASSCLPFRLPPPSST